MTVSADILLITHRSPEYARRSIGRLLDTCPESSRVWLWHNGDDEATLEVTRSFASHPRVHELHHSRENVGLRAPTNWLWGHATGDYVSKVDDDCLEDPNWLEVLGRAHQDVEGLGAIAAWRFFEEDFVPELAEPKIHTFPGGHRLLRNCWVQGSGYLLPRAAVVEHGVLRPNETWTQYCRRLAYAGLVHGWYYPFVREDHMDDPRSPNTLLTSDADFRARRPLSAQRLGIETLDGWLARMRASALEAQTASIDPAVHWGMRMKVRRAGRRALRRLRFAQ